MEHISQFSQPCMTPFCTVRTKYHDIITRLYVHLIQMLLVNYQNIDQGETLACSFGRRQTENMGRSNIKTNKFFANLYILLRKNENKYESCTHSTSFRTLPDACNLSALNIRQNTSSTTRLRTQQTAGLKKAFFGPKPLILIILQGK